MAARDHASTRDHSLDQIDTGNVAALRLAFRSMAGILQRRHGPCPGFQQTRPRCELAPGIGT
jgi:hypothetical protein